MTDYRAHAAGTFSWVELSTTDTAAAKAFYGAVMGWSYVDRPTPIGLPYTIVYKGGRQVGGLCQAWQQANGACWNLFVASDDADATVAKVVRAGGKVVMPPIDVMGEGRMCVATDSAGAAFSVWQARNHKGVQLKDEPGSLGWAELDTPDVAGATAFYRDVFGWECVHQGRHTGEYYFWKRDGAEVGGMLSLAEPWAKGIPPHWLAYLGVESADATLALVAAKGGTAVTEVMEVAGRLRFAIVRDPQGAVFAIQQRLGPAV